MDTKTENKPTNLIDLPGANTSLARVNASTLWQAPEWTEERRALARKAVCPPGTTDAEFEFFFAWCQRTGLDPFIKQAYMVERKQKLPDGRWHTKNEPMAAESGMAARADALPDFEGMKAAAVYAGDEFSIDEVSQEIHHKWNLKARRDAGNKVIGAWAHLKRRGRSVPITYLPIESRLQTRWDERSKQNVPTKFWATDPAGQIVKCARAAQYRLGFANIFGGVYIVDEYKPEEVDVTPTAVASDTPAHAETRTQSVASKVAAKAAAVKKPSPTPPEITDAEYSEPPPPTDADAPPEVQEQASPMAAAAAALREKAASEAARDAVMVFGGKALKGRPIAELDGEDLQNAIDLGEAQVAKTPGAKWVADVRTCLEHLRAEQQKRLDALGGEA